MAHYRRNAWLAGLLFVALLVLPSLACTQAGEILSAEEATARAQQALEPTPTNPAAVQAKFKPGDEVEFVGSGYLVPLYQDIGDRAAYSHAGRGETGIVEGSQEKEGEIWYLVDGPSGEGWVPADSLRAVGAAEEEGPAGPQVGDTVYLTGKGYLISLMDAPGSLKMIAGQERGVEVTILEVVDHEGEPWYKIDAPTGEGWVKAENIVIEKP